MPKVVKATVAERVQSELEGLEVANTGYAAVALILADILDTATPSTKVAAAKELRETLRVLGANTLVDGDAGDGATGPLDELKAKRERDRAVAEG